MCVWCGCECVGVCVLKVIKKILNEVLQCVYVFNKVHYALGSAYILSTLLFLHYVLQTHISCTVSALDITSFTSHYFHQTAYLTERERNSRKRQTEPQYSSLSLPMC